MTEGFDWVPFYDEMAENLLGFRSNQPALIKILENADINGLKDRNLDGTKIPLKEIDPFTFVALLNKQSLPERARLLEVIGPQLGVVARPPKGFHGVPKVDARQAWFFPYQFERNPDDVAKLWDLYEAVLSGDKISDKIFADAQGVRYVGHAKLTQGIFRAAPARFFPVDKQTISYLARLRLPYEFKSAREFQSICKRVATSVNKPLYEQSYDAWCLNQKHASAAEPEYQTKISKAISRNTAFVEQDGGITLPNIGQAGINDGGFKRNPNVAAEAIRRADFKCEIDANHQTFTSRSSGQPYLEAHHLIPFGNQSSYPFSLDVVANIVALCPNCHRRLHHGRPEDKAKDLAMLFQSRRSRLEEKELTISESGLLKLYRGDLLEEGD